MPGVDVEVYRRQPRAMTKLFQLYLCLGTTIAMTPLQAKIGDLKRVPSAFRGQFYHLTAVVAHKGATQHLKV